MVIVFEMKVVYTLTTLSTFELADGTVDGKDNKEEKTVLSGLVFARKIARKILIQNIYGLIGPLMINMAFMPFYM